MELPKPLTTHTRLWEALGGAVLIVWGIYKKEVQDFLRDFFKRAYNGWFKKQPARRVTDSELAEILGADLKGLTTLLLLLEREYLTDRVSITEYVEQPDGGALGTCVAEARQWDMVSVLDMNQTPIPRPLWLQIKRITNNPNRVRYVSDAPHDENVTLRDALLKSGVYSAYYQAMPDPTEEYTKITLLSLSWHTQHSLSDEELRVLLQSGVACATVLSSMERLRKTSTT